MIADWKKQNSPPDRYQVNRDGLKEILKEMEGQDYSHPPAIDCTGQAYIRQMSHEALLSDGKMGITQKILQEEPIEGRVQLIARGKPVKAFNGYLQKLHKAEAEAETAAKTEKGDEAIIEFKRYKPHTLFQQKNVARFDLRISFETSNGTIGQYRSIAEKKQLLKTRPLQYLLDTEFLTTLQQEIHVLETVIGESSTLPIREQYGICDLTDESYALHFPVREEHIYVFTSAKETAFVGSFSTADKQQRYGQIGLLACNAEEQCSTETRRIVEKLLQNGFFSLDLEYGRQRIKQLEDAAIRHYGFLLLDKSDRSLAAKYIRLNLSSMERYALLPKIAAQQSTGNFDLKIWESLQEIVRKGNYGLTTLPPQTLLHFIKPTTTGVAQHLFERLTQNSMGKSNIFATDFASLDQVTQRVIIAQKIEQYRQERNSEPQGIRQEEVLRDFCHDFAIAKEQLEKVEEVADILFA